MLGGCWEQEIYSEIVKPAFIAHPPLALHIEDPSGHLKSDFSNNPKAPIFLEVYIYSAHCTNAQSRSLGTDFDGYIRIAVQENNSTIARAQMDYKGEPTGQKIQYVYDHLMENLKWSTKKER